MNNFFLIIFIYLLEKAYLEYETIELEDGEHNYYIPLKFPNNNLKTSYIFSTKLPKSFFPSSNCTYCFDFKINNAEFKEENKSIALPYYYLNFTGKLYNGNYSTDNCDGEHYFLLFDNLSYIKNYTEKGIFSLSYLNYNFNTAKKIFALKFFPDRKSELHLGDYEHNRNIDELKTFNIVKEYIYENYTETIINNKLNNIFQNNLLSEEENNVTYENVTYEVDKSMWYMNFSKLVINDKNINKPMNEYKLTLDMSTDKFYIPRNFFINNVDKILPKEAKCQITREGNFNCQCDEEYKTKFSNFKFITENGVEFLVNVTDYMTYQSSIYGSKCEVNLVINYDNDLFIGGITVLNNYYSIFNIENNTLSIYPKENNNIKQTAKFIILFFIVLFLAIGLLFGGYYFYNKYIINDPIGLAVQNHNNNDNNNNNNIRQIQDLQRQNEFQPDENDQNIGNGGNNY